MHIINFLCDFRTCYNNKKWEIFYTFIKAFMNKNILNDYYTPVFELKHPFLTSSFLPWFRPQFFLFWINLSKNSPLAVRFTDSTYCRYRHNIIYWTSWCSITNIPSSTSCSLQCRQHSLPRCEMKYIQTVNIYVMGMWLFFSKIQLSTLSAIITL